MILWLEIFNAVLVLIVAWRVWRLVKTIEEIQYTEIERLKRENNTLPPNVPLWPK